MQILFTQEELKGFLKGNIIKYSLRVKEDEVKDKQKLIQYTQRYLDVCNGKGIDPW